MSLVSNQSPSKCPPPITAWYAELSASAKSTSDDAMPTPKSFTTSQERQDVLSSVSYALMGKEAALEVSSIELLASGGYNHIW